MTETNRVEFKEKLTDTLEKEVVAFLNYKEGGVIYLGIDKDGNSIGLTNLDETQLKIKDKLKHNIEPSCLGLFDMVLEERNNKEILKIIVASGSETPYYVKKYGMSPRGCFIRLGSASEPMSTTMIEELFSKRTRNSLGKIKSHRQDLTFEQSKLNIKEYNSVVLAVAHSEYTQAHSTLNIQNSTLEKQVVFDIKSVLTQSDGRL